MSDVVEEDVVEEVEEETSQGTEHLAMSDEDFLNAPVPEEVPHEEEEAPAETEDPAPTEEEEETVEEEETAAPDVDDTAPEPEASKTEGLDSPKEIDYKAEYEKLLGKFKANGKDMKVDSVDDAMTLMKMGANYNKKMAALKPNLKLMKMLENNELLNEAKLSHLIDLDKKHPEAITKLLKDSKLDPLDIDTDKETDYRPSTYTVNDKEVELDEVLDEIRDTASYSSTIDVISNKWDESSKTVLLDNPSIIKVINEHMASGIYEQIAPVVEQQRMLGKLAGLSDLDAYKQVGDAIQANGGFANQQAAPQGTEQPITKAKASADPKLKDRKRAASSTKSAPGKKRPNDFNPLSLSDEDFEKEMEGKFLN
jgi:hypothetical protein